MKGEARRPARIRPLRLAALLAAAIGGPGLAYLAWSPGEEITDGRHDRGENGIWLAHGWLGDDAWFERNRRDRAAYRGREAVGALAARLAPRGMRDLFPHLCPCAADGEIPPVDADQTEIFLDAFPGCRVLPWVGGVLGRDCRPDAAPWKARFIASARSLLEGHPRLAGIHVNIEPLPSGHAGFLTLLRELRAALPPGKLLSVAAYPPPTRWHPAPEVHWDEAHFREVAANADQVAVMMYDTAIRWSKVYRHLMAGWTEEVLAWSPAEVLLGVPAYDDAGSGYHDPAVECLENALPGIHEGLSRRDRLPDNYRGIAIYCEWEMDGREWELLDRGFRRQ